MTLEKDIENLRKIKEDYPAQIRVNPTIDYSNRKQVRQKKETPFYTPEEFARVREEVRFIDSIVL